MSIKYFYYISETKVDMLYSQLKQFTFPKVKPKINVAGLELEANIESPTYDNLVTRLTQLLKLMNNQKLIKSVPNELQIIDTESFWHDKQVWHSGIYSFGEPKGDSIASYFLWRKFQNSLILLVGSPANILGEKTVEGSALVLGRTPGILEELFSFSKLIMDYIKPDENITVLSKRGVKAEIKETAGNPKEKQQILNSPITKLNWENINNKRVKNLSDFDKHLYSPVPSRALSLGVFCLRYLFDLPERDVDTVFKLFYKLEMKTPEDLPIWIKELNLLGMSDLEKVRTVLIGSPLYIALN